MRFVSLALAGAVAASASGALAQTPPPPPPPPQGAMGAMGAARAPQYLPGTGPALTPSQMRRRDALMGEGWQFRVAPPDAATVAAMNAADGPPAADLSNLDLRIRTDEVRLTRLRDSALARGNARVFEVEPALPYERETRKKFDLDRYLINLDPYFVDLWNNIRSVPDRIF